LRRKLEDDISTTFPSLSAVELSELVPNKEELNVVKIYAHKGDAVTLYVLHKNPVFFELEKRVYPTVYKLWRYPHVLPAFTTWPPVLQKLAGGADLMLPGVVVPPSGIPEVKKGDFCAVKVVSNRAPVAVEMQVLGMKGRGVSIFHTYMDNKAGPPSIPDVDTEGFKAMYGEEEEDDEQATEGGEEEPCPNPEDPRSPHLPAIANNPSATARLYLRCILFPLIILEMFLQLDWSPPEARTCLYKVPQLIVQVRANTNHDASSCVHRTLDKMQHCHQLVFPGQPPIVKKGHIEPIDISVASRSSNKQVTMINNLEGYGVDPMAVLLALQHRVQASSALNSVPGSKDRVLVQMQGNWYIQGLDKVQKPEKKK
uniref:Eukaryotic translation initiation factor 2D n=1 Tax=Salmo trutta TaxID=8032 RepID=A0A673YCQ6_SALTR